MKRLGLRISLPTLTIVLVTSFLAAYAVRPAGAQEGPECPGGFFWRADSGVGCMQEGCLEIANAKYSYTGACICMDGYKACYEPVDAAGVECGPFCPVSRLTTCVTPDAACPGEVAATAPEGGSADAPSVEDGEDSVDEPDAEPSGTDVDLSTDELVRDLEEFLAGGRVRAPGAGQAAAAGTATATLIGTWVLINLLSGARLDDLLTAVSRWQGGDRARAGGSRSSVDPLGDSSHSADAAPERGEGGGSATGGVSSATAAGVKSSPSVTGASPPAQPEPPTPSSGAKPETPGARSAAAEHSSDLGAAQPDVEAQVRLLQRRFKELVDEALKADLYVMNRNLVEKAWNRTVGGTINFLRGKYGGQCGEFAEWGTDWTRVYAEEIFGEGVVVDPIRVEEGSSGRAQSLIRDPIEWADSFYRANHAAVRVILPNGESYVLDFWQAIGDRQRGLYEEAVDYTHDKFFGGSAKQPEVKIVKEKEWLKTWKERVGGSGDPAVAHNLNEDQQLLKTMIDTLGDEERAIQTFRRTMEGKLPGPRLEAIVNNYRENGLWWEREF
jgi:hypothetical protein